MKIIRFCALFGFLVLSMSAFSVEAKSIKISVAMTKIIGMFGTYGHPQVGDEFELDLDNLPKGMIVLSRPNADKPLPQIPFSYIPFSSPLVMDNNHGRIHLISSDSVQKLVIQIYAHRFEKDQKVRVFIFEENFGEIWCMAEANGVVK